jgi:mannose-6-phosphate isomerase-like protein (cupin superfamily)
MKKGNLPGAVALITRRDTLLLGATVCSAAIAKPTSAATSGSANQTFAKDTEVGSMRRFEAIHAGKGSVNIKRFGFDGLSARANFIIYDIPPGASEGVHVHHLDNRNNEGPFDEYYYIVSGQGQMRIGDVIVPVAAGDNVHTPLDVPHGIENTHAEEHLKVRLTFITRTA